MKKPKLTTVLLFLMVLFCIFSLFILSSFTLQRFSKVSAQLEETAAFFDSTLQYSTAQKNPVPSNAPVNTPSASNPSHQVSEQDPSYIIETPNKPSVFSLQTQDVFNDTEASGGFARVIAIDPGHQSASIDMSEPEPIGPGATETKAKATTGTQGSYTGTPEYALNLDVSLLLKEILEQRGYQVIMTRTDNETAISNKERAELVSQQGADIYIRIHANGNESSDISGALTICPSAQNRFVSHLFEDSQRLSSCILESYCTSTGFSNLGIQYRDDMTGINWSSIPVTILEMGFMTNEQDDIQMNDPSFRHTMATGIANGIDTYFNNN